VRLPGLAVEENGWLPYTPVRSCSGQRRPDTAHLRNQSEDHFRCRTFSEIKAICARIRSGTFRIRWFDLSRACDSVNPLNRILTLGNGDGLNRIVCSENGCRAVRPVEADAQKAFPGRNPD